MKSLIKAVALVVAVAAPVASFAQSNVQLTRAQVRNELVQLKKAGYHVGDGDQTSYPAQIQAAIARVAAHSTSGFGGVNSGSSAAGVHAVASASDSTGIRSVYAAH
jgi:hypothetical protein